MGEVTDHAHSPELVAKLSGVARQLRVDALTMIHRRGQGHPGGALSAAEVVAALYFHHLRLDPARPDWDERDRFILSKGHASAILYPALARRGYFPLAELETWGHLDSHLQGHPDRLKTPGVEMSTGCLGHGVSIGAGLCLAARLRGWTTAPMCSSATASARRAWSGKGRCWRPSTGFRS